MAKHKLLSSETKWDEATLREVLVGQVAGFLRTHTAQVDPDKSFDDYGLDSIDAVIATEQIGKKLGIELPPEFLLHHRTVNAIVRALLNNQFTDVPANARQAQKALIFLFPPAGGREFIEQCASTLNFEIVRSDGPISAFTSPSGDWREWIKHDFDFDKLATRACSYIETIQAEGPVRLAGHSLGGLLAYVSALTLSRAGRRVEFVGLLDSGVRMNNMPNRHYKSARVRLVHAHWRQCCGPVERRKLLTLLAQNDVLFRGAGGVRLNKYIQMRLFAELWDDWFAKNGRSQRLDAPVFLFRSDCPGPRGWKDCCSDLTVIPVAGDHFTMFDTEHLEGLVTSFVTAAQREAHSNRPVAVQRGIAESW
jgi:thioesterase domain-containing protein/acyl carrier protein